MLGTGRVHKQLSENWLFVSWKAMKGDNDLGGVKSEAWVNCWGDTNSGYNELQHRRGGHCLPTKEQCLPPTHTLRVSQLFHLHLWRANQRNIKHSRRVREIAQRVEVLGM